MLMCVCAALAYLHDRFERLLTLVHSVKGASLLVGGPGTAKTTVINQFMGKFNSEVGGVPPVQENGVLHCCPLGAQQCVAIFCAA